MTAATTIEISRIYPSLTARSLQERQVVALVESIGEIGLRMPITVKPVMRVVDGRDQSVFEIVAGHHRYEAAVRLGWHEIPAFIFDGAELDAELWEIDENLCRAELSEIERGRALARRKEIYEIKHPETRQHVAGGKARQDAASDNLSFAADASAKTGKSARSVERSVRIGEKLTAEAEDVAKEVGLDDNQSALLAAAKHTSKEAQIAALRQKAAERAERKAREHGEVKDTKADAREVLAQRIADNISGEDLADVTQALSILGQKEVVARIQALTGAVFDNTRAGAAA